MARQSALAPSVFLGTAVLCLVAVARAAHLETPRESGGAPTPQATGIERGHAQGTSTTRVMNRVSTPPSTPSAQAVLTVAKRASRGDLNTVADLVTLTPASPVAPGGDYLLARYLTQVDCGPAGNWLFDQSSGWLTVTASIPRGTKVLVVSVAGELHGNGSTLFSLRGAASDVKFAENPRDTKFKHLAAFDVTGRSNAVFDVQFDQAESASHWVSNVTIQAVK